MATEGYTIPVNIKAAEDLSTAGHEYVAVSAAGLVANNTESTVGFLHSKPVSGDAAQCVWIGETKVRAGQALAVGQKIKVTTSGYVVPAGSFDNVIGECIREAVTSGSIGTCLVVCPNNRDVADDTPYSVTPKATFIAGSVLALADFLQANNGEEASLVIESATNSGTAVVAKASGIVSGVVGATTSAGNVLTVATSGYFTPGDSGDYICARALANITSGSQGDILFTGVGYYLSV